MVYTSFLHWRDCYCTSSLFYWNFEPLLLRCNIKVSPAPRKGNNISIVYAYYHTPSPPVAAEIFGKIERCDFITRSHRSVYITTWLISLFRVEPLVTAASALVESVCHAGEQFSISVAVIVLIVFLTPCAVAGVKHLVLSSAGSGGCAYSVGGHFGCHSFAV